MRTGMSLTPESPHPPAPSQAERCRHPQTPGPSLGPRRPPSQSQRHHSKGRVFMARPGQAGGGPDPRGLTERSPLALGAVAAVGALGEAGAAGACPGPEPRLPAPPAPWPAWPPSGRPAAPSCAAAPPASGGHRARPGPGSCGTGWAVGPMEETGCSGGAVGGASKSGRGHIGAWAWQYRVWVEPGRGRQGLGQSDERRGVWAGAESHWRGGVRW